MARVSNSRNDEWGALLFTRLARHRVAVAVVAIVAFALLAIVVLKPDLKPSPTISAVDSSVSSAAPQVEQSQFSAAASQEVRRVSKRVSKNAVSAYEWRRLDLTPLTSLTQPFGSIAKFGIKTVSLDLSYVVDLSEVANPTQRATAQKAATKKLRSYVKAANKRGLAVEALAGDPRWMEPEVRYVNQIIQRYVTDFNRGAKSAKAKLVATHFDIEPWGRSDWANNRVTLTRQFLDTIKDIVAYQKSLPAKDRVPVNVDLPFWWDGTTAPKSVKYGSRSASPTAHVMRLLDPGAKSKVRNGVTVMAYRDSTSGPDGSVALASKEFSLAKQHKGRVKVSVAHEIGNVEPARITFHEEGAAAMKRSMNVHKKRFSGHKAWGGLAVDHVQALHGKLK